MIRPDVICSFNYSVVVLAPSEASSKVARIQESDLRHDRSFLVAFMIFFSSNLDSLLF